MTTSDSASSGKTPRRRTARTATTRGTRNTTSRSTRDKQTTSSRRKPATRGGRKNTIRRRVVADPKGRSSSSGRTRIVRSSSSATAATKKSVRPKSGGPNKKKPTTTRRKVTRSTPGKKPGGRGSSSLNKSLARLKRRQHEPLPKRNKQTNVADLPPLKDGDIRIIPLCGVEWVGTNMTAVEYKDEIIVIDAGFGFSNPDTPGIDYTIPDVTYLEANKDKIKGLVITHGHMDHVGGIPYVIEKIGNPPIYTREFGAIFIQKRMEEFPHLPKLNIVTITKDDGYLPVGGSKHLKVKFFGLTHSIPDSTGVIIQTPLGGIVSTGDVRVENVDGIPDPEEVEQYKFFKNEDILLMTMDSTGVIKPGWSKSETSVKQTIDEIIRVTTGRLFIAGFSSQVERMISFMASAKKYGKYIAIEGRSMKNNLAIAKQLELTDFSHVIPIGEMDNYPPNKIVVLMTGAQGENFSALDRVGRDIHRNIKLNETDTVVLSSSVIPGNDWQIAKLKDNLYRGSYNVITYTDNQVHASGHGKREELAWIHKQIPYKFFMPIHGEHNMLKVHAKLAVDLGVPKENIVVPDNGSIIEIRDNGNKVVMLEEKAPAAMVVVDGNMVGPIPEVVMRDRKMLGESGIFVVVVTIDTKTGKLRKSPDLISRGFIYLRDNQELLQKARRMIKKTVEQNTQNANPINFEFVKTTINDTVSKFLFQKTGKLPIIIPVVLSV